jgi:hypothetical protein
MMYVFIVLRRKFYFFINFQFLTIFIIKFIILPQNSNFPIEVQKPIFDMLFVCVFSNEKPMFHFCCNYFEVKPNFWLDWLDYNKQFFNCGLGTAILRVITNTHHQAASEVITGLFYQAQLASNILQNNIISDPRQNHLGMF